MPNTVSTLSMVVHPTGSRSTRSHSTHNLSMARLAGIRRTRRSRSMLRAWVADRTMGMVVVIITRGFVMAVGVMI